MKKKNNIVDKEFDTVKTFRVIKEKLSSEMAKMNRNDEDKISSSNVRLCTY